MSDLVERILNGESIRTVCCESEDKVAATDDKYVLFTPSDEFVFDDLDSAKEAYKNSSEKYKFLYEPDKNYFLLRISSTGSKIGHDHGYHKDTAKCWGLFRAKSKNQISNYLAKSGWRHNGSNTKASVARILGRDIYNSKQNWDAFKRALHVYYLSGYNIRYYSDLISSFGAVDVDTRTDLCGIYNNPYDLA